MRTKILPLFIPQVGCPHQCLFCNQHAITEAALPSPAAITAELDTYLAHCPPTARVEIAFFGGSFTLLPHERMVAYLAAAEPFLADGRVAAIRISTRPDGINAAVIQVLLRYHVTTVELGVQSMDDAVLAATRRGHTAYDTRQAIRLLQDAGIAVVGQMMLGLPTASAESEQETARALVAHGVVATRIYPLVVLPDTELARMQATGQFVPLSQEEMVERGADVLAVFADANIPVLRIGLCANETLGALPTENGFHPAIGEMIRAALYERRMDAALAALPVVPSRVTVWVPRGATSQAVGQQKAVKARLAARYHTTLNIRECDTLAPYHICIR